MMGEVSYRRVKNHLLMGEIYIEKEKCYEWSTTIDLRAGPEI